MGHWLSRLGMYVSMAVIMLSFGAAAHITVKQEANQVIVCRDYHWTILTAKYCCSWAVPSWNSKSLLSEMLYTSCSQSRVSFDSNKPSYLLLYAYAVGAFALCMLCLLRLPVPPRTTCLNDQQHCVF